MTELRTPPHGVDPVAIPAALRDIWKECRGGGDESISRALTLNLVACVDERRQDELRELIGTLASRRPCRAFLTVISPGAAAVTAAVQGSVRCSRNTRDLMLELIELHLSASESAEAVGIVRPLLVNDIPTHAYWATRWPKNAAVFDALLELCDHVVVDSSRFELPDIELERLDERRQAGAVITDLTWLRLRPWRRAMAEIFERAAYNRLAPTTVTIHCPTRAVAAAALLGRWLERELGATVQREEAEPGVAGLHSVDLQHGDATASARLIGDRIEVEVETASACYLPFSVPASRGTEGGLLAAAIDMA